MVEGVGMGKVHVQVQRPRQLTLMSTPSFLSLLCVLSLMSTPFFFFFFLSLLCVLSLKCMNFHDKLVLLQGLICK
jgi:hypothetical protein